MSKQNIYDNDTFFTDFKKIRRNRVNFNDLLETPVLMKMLPDLKGRSVLDIGCGMGQHAMQYATLGAERVLGIDISAKMLAYARENNSAECITYRNQCHLVNQFQIKIQWFSFRESHCFFSSKT